MRARVFSAAWLALGVAGCGDRALWERWRAERALWWADRAAAVAARVPYERKPGPWRRAERAYRDIVSAFPSGRVAPSGRRADVARVSATAAVRLAALLGSSGRGDEAVAAWREACANLAPLPREAHRAARGLIAQLESLGRWDEALAARAALAEAPMLDETGAPIPSALEAPLELAREWHARGRDGDAHEVMERATRRLRAALVDARERDAGVMWQALGEWRAAAGDVDGAKEALRWALAHATRDAERADLVLRLARRSLDFGRPDSARAYAAWAATFRGPVAARAHLLAGDAWRRSGEPDSAIAAWGEALDRTRDPFHPVGQEARFKRAEVLEQQGQWERARLEYRTLQSASPTAALSFLSLRRIVQHHLERGETELARVEGRRAVETLDNLLSVNRDRSVQCQARTVRADLLAMTGQSAAAESAYVELWLRFPGDSATEAAALGAARMAEASGERSARARRIYMALAGRATNATVRAEAAEASVRYRP